MAQGGLKGGRKKKISDAGGKHHGLSLETAREKNRPLLPRGGFGGVPRSQRGKKGKKFFYPYGQFPMEETFPFHGEGGGSRGNGKENAGPGSNKNPDQKGPLREGKKFHHCPRGHEGGGGEGEIHFGGVKRTGETQ